MLQQSNCDLLNTSLWSNSERESGGKLITPKGKKRRIKRRIRTRTRRRKSTKKVDKKKNKI